MDKNIKNITKEELEKVIEKYVTYKASAKYLGINEKTFKTYAQKFGIKSKIGSQGARRRMLDENYFETIDTEERAYWLGFIMADGCIYAGAGNNSYRLQINLAAKDKYVLECFLKCIKSDYKIQEKDVSGHPSCLLKINSTKMCNDLINLGVIQRKSLRNVFPSIPQCFERHFIRGYFDGDGCISVSNGKYTFNICSGFDMAVELQKRLLDTNIYRLKRNSKICYVETSALQTIINIYHYMYDNSSICIKRKKDIFDSILLKSH